MLARCGRAKVSMPGGDEIGARPVDLHVRGLERMGATIRFEHGFLFAEADDLHGAPITLEDHQRSRLVVDPFRLLDCCRDTDGGVDTDAHLRLSEAIELRERLDRAIGIVASIADEIDGGAGR